MGRDRRPPADPQWGPHLRGEGRCAHVALGRQPPDHARAAIEVLVRPGDPQAQGDRLGQAEPRLRSGAPMTDYREADFSRLKTVPIAQRPNKVDPSLLAHPPRGDPSFTAFWDSLPDILAAKDLRTLARQLAKAAGRRGVVAMLGGHVIKVGLGPLFGELIRRGVITHLALNGSAAIHDFELAAYGGTSEDAAAGRAVPVTVHATLGADIIHQHPAADGAALGATSHRDFKRLAGSLPALHDGGVVLNVGSAVVMPEVFLKALTIARNLGGGKPTGFTACDCDMQRHYRPRVNVVERPTLAGGRGIQLTGHHEILIPLLAWAVIRELDER